MGVEKRKVNVEFTGIDSVVITNIYYQKSFFVTESCIVDLLTCKKINTQTLSGAKLSKSPFFIFFQKRKGENFFTRNRFL
jgi:hypothetical protein